MKEKRGKKVDLFKFIAKLAPVKKMGKNNFVKQITKRKIEKIAERDNATQTCFFFSLSFYFTTQLTKSL